MGGERGIWGVKGIVKCGYQKGMHGVFGVCKEWQGTVRKRLFGVRKEWLEGEGMVWIAINPYRDRRGKQCGKEAVTSRRNGWRGRGEQCGKEAVKSRRNGWRGAGGTVWKGSCEE
jgi:hypothetical protein